VADANAQGRPLQDMAFYERMITEGLADADRRGGPVDHVTARRIAIWLAAHPQQPALAQALTRFTRTGAITQALKKQLRDHAYSTSYPHRSEVFRLVQYCASRSASPGPVGLNFGGDCAQIDQADAMLADLRDRVKQGIAPPAQAWPDTDGPPVIARAERDPRGHTVSLILDETTANIAMHAIAAHAQEREAHVREVQQFAQGLPDGSYGKQNRQAIAARETRVAARLRAIERAYQAAPDRAATADPANADRPTDRMHEREMELELDCRLLILSGKRFAAISATPGCISPQLFSARKVTVTAAASYLPLVTQTRLRDGCADRPVTQ
jgi:hypothetical protein